MAWSAAAMLAVVCAVILAPSLASGELPYPGCGFKRVTGLPCPGCGGTRSLASLAQGDVPAALVLNPLVVFLSGAIALGLLAALIDAAAWRGRLALRMGSCLSCRPFIIVVVGAVVTNWLWLLVRTS